MKNLQQFCLISICLFLAVAAPVSARSPYEDADTTARSNRTDYASLNMHIDRQGDARLSLWFPAKLDDPERVKRALAQSLGCELQFDEDENQLNVERADDAESTTQASWFFSNGHCANAFPGEGLTSSGRIDFAPLIASLRTSMLQLLVVGIAFDADLPNLKLTGAKPVGTTALNYYQTQFNVFGYEKSDLEFSWGYSRADVLWKLVPLAVFILIPALWTLWMGWSVLKMQDRTAEIWGRYFHFLFRLLNVVWLVWLPVCSLSDFGQIIAMLVGRNYQLLGEISSLTYYFVPPLLVVYLCHFLSFRVYRRVRNSDWSAREVVSQAILANALSIMPLFFLLLAVNTFTSGTRYAGVFLILGFACWFVWGQLASKAFNRSMYAVTSGELRDRVFDLAERAGVKLKQIYVLPDAKAQMSNAFARSDNAVMLTGSLLKHLSKREVDGILAHEIGHLKEKHPQRSSWTMLIAVVVTNIVGMALASVIGFQNSTPVIISLGLAAAILALHFVSRSNERHADAIAVSLTGDPEAFISGLAKLSRLNLMPLHSGGWGESLETHPRMMRRLSDIARLHAISDQRLTELTAKEIPESRYSVSEGQAAAGRIFSTERKKKISIRRALVFLATLVLMPVPIVWLLSRMQLGGLPLILSYLIGIFVSFGLAQLARNFVACWGYPFLERSLRSKLSGEGLDIAAQNGVVVGLSPAAETRMYEDHMFWDIGVLWLSDEKLYYLGEETRFALERSRIQDVYLGDSRAEWLPEKNLYIRLFDREGEPGNTFHLLSLNGTVREGRRELTSLRDRIHKWMAHTKDFPDAPTSLQEIAEPRFPEVTSQLASNKFNLPLVLKASFQILCMSGVASFAIGLTFWSACYAAATVVFIVFFDELPKLFRPSNPGPAVEPQNFQTAAWAESNAATTQSVR